MKTKLIPVKLIQVFRCDYCKKQTKQTITDASGKGLKVFVCSICGKSTWFVHN